eukprot:GHVH01007115.1.p1 GENE.GHVH01007115.1~~GHVH01007115.1.p1  ORF type:complete len:600 (+),score=83.07 GHVH01007115.1:68-1867(+)
MPSHVDSFIERENDAPVITGKEMFEVLVMDGISEDGLKPLLKEPNVNLTVIEGTRTEDEVCELVKGKHALLVRSATVVTPKILAANPKLLIVGRAGVGVDNIDIKAATAQGVFVVNSPLGNVVAAAEHTVAMIFAAVRRIPAAHMSLAVEGKWARSQYVGKELRNRTLGVLGCGQVGSRVTRILKEAGMKVVVYDPFMNDKKAEMLGVEKVETVEEVFVTADVVTLHLPKTAQTVGLVNGTLLRMMKRGSVVVNVARGGILNEADCVEVLLEGHLSCAAIDVFSKEPIEESNPFLKAAKELGHRLIITPHLGASTEEAQLQVAVEVCDQCIEVFNGRVPSSAVNKCSGVGVNPGYEHDEIAFLVDAVEYIGNLLQQVVRLPISQLNVTVEGDYFLKMMSAHSLATYAAVGYLKAQQGDEGRVNLVNVENTLKENMIELTSTGIPHTRHSEFRISATSTKGRTYEIRGTVSSRLPNDVIIRQFFGVPCHMKIALSQPGQLVYSFHNDVPGVLARMTSAFSNSNINISDCHLARISPTQVSAQSINNGSPMKSLDYDLAIALVVVSANREDVISALSDVSQREEIIEIGVVNLPVSGYSDC